MRLPTGVEISINVFLRGGMGGGPLRREATAMAGSIISLPSKPQGSFLVQVVQVSSDLNDNAQTHSVVSEVWNSRVGG